MWGEGYQEGYKYTIVLTQGARLTRQGGGSGGKAEISGEEGSPPAGDGNLSSNKKDEGRGEKKNIFGGLGRARRGLVLSGTQRPRENPPPSPPQTPGTKRKKPRAEKTGMWIFYKDLRREYPMAAIKGSI